MDDETAPPSSPQTRPTQRNRARPSMGGSGLFGAARPSPTVSPNNSDKIDVTQLIEQASNHESPAPKPQPIQQIQSEIKSDNDLHHFFKKIGTRIHMDGLIRSNAGTIAQLDPDIPAIVHMSKKGTILSEISSTDIISYNLGMSASMEAPENHRLIFVLLAQLSLNNPGQAAVILSQSPWTIAASSNEDVFVLDASHVGLGRIAIIDEGSEESQIAEITDAVTQMNGPAVVIRNQFILGFGTDLESIALKLSILEQEMQRKILN